MLQTATAPRGMVTAPHHLAAQAGVSVLRDGGNAVEAMVATAATIAVVYPHMNSIGGDGFWLISRPDRPPFAIDACGRAASLATPAFYRSHELDAIPTRGPLAANTVAGAISGWQAALDATGSRLPLERLLRDAVWYARHGVPATENQALYTKQYLGELASQPGFADTYLDESRVPRGGRLRRYPRLATLFDRLARNGLADFYRGDVAADIGRELEALGSPLRREDLARHRASIVEPLSLALEIGTVYNLPPPTQGLASLMILGIFERIASKGADGFDHVHRLVEATKRAFIVRNRFVCDPDVMTANPSDFLTPQALDAHAADVDTARALPWDGSTPKGDTVWMGAADADGCIVSYIQSVYWEFGAGIVLDTTGSVWQNRGSSFSLDAKSHVALAPGRKPFHTLNPAFAQLDDGRRVAYGTMGGDGQPQTQAALFTRYAMFGQDVQRAISAPRWLLGRTWGKQSVTLKLEQRFDAALVDALRRAGHDVELVEPYSQQVGHAGAIVVHPTGAIEGASDPRSDGMAAGF